MKNYGIILASGVGKRFGSELPKQLAKISGKTIFEHTLQIFENSNYIDYIIVVVNPLYRNFFEKIIINSKASKVLKIVNGGDTRKESSAIGINCIEEQEANIIIHDSVRPFLSEDIIEKCVKALEVHNAIDVAIPATDTLIRVENDYIVEIPKRENYMQGQTPQCFKLSLIKKAHNLSKNDNDFTDDCGLILKYNLDKVYVIKGSNTNIKITHKEDIFLADKLFQINSKNIHECKNVFDFSGKIAIIFGGNTGIGKIITEGLSSFGVKTYPLSRNNGCDINDYIMVDKKIQEIYQKNNRIDFVISSAGILNMGSIESRNFNDIINEISVNYIAQINLVKSSLKYLKETKGHVLLFTSSSYTRGRALYSIYSSSKAAIVNFTQAIAEEYSDFGVKINVINPQRTATAMRFKAFGKEDPETLLDPEVVAKVAIDTLKSNLTGQVIDVRK